MKAQETYILQGFLHFCYDVTVEKGERERVPHRKGLARLVAMLRSENVTVT